MTPQENCKKSAKACDYSFVTNNHKNKKCVKKCTWYNKILVSTLPGIWKMVCNGYKCCKSGISKKDGCNL